MAFYLTAVGTSIVEDTVEDWPNMAIFYSMGSIGLGNTEVLLQSFSNSSAFWVS